MTGMFAISLCTDIDFGSAKCGLFLRPNIALLNQLWAPENIGMANGVIQALTIVAIPFSSFLHFLSL